MVTIGSFDGVHEGHRILLDHLKAMARRLDAESVVVTFDPHPRIAMGRDEGMGLLTTVEERALLLEAEGIDHLVAVGDHHLLWIGVWRSGQVVAKQRLVWCKLYHLWIYHHQFQLRGVFLIEE